MICAHTQKTKLKKTIFIEALLVSKLVTANECDYYYFFVWPEDVSTVMYTNMLNK